MAHTEVKFKHMGEQTHGLSLNVSEWPASHSGHFIPKERDSSSHWIERLEEPQSQSRCSGRKKKNFDPTWSEAPGIQLAMNLLLTELSVLQRLRVPKISDLQKVSEIIL